MSNMFTFSNPSNFAELSPRPDYPCVGAIKLKLDADPEKVFKVKNAFGKALPEEVQYRELPLEMTTVQKVKGADGVDMDKRITFSVSIDGAFLPLDDGAYYHPSLQERDANGRKMSNDRATTNLLGALGMASGTYIDVVNRLAQGVEVPAVYYPSRPGLQAETRPLSDKALKALIARSPNGIVDDRPQPKKKGGAAAEGVAAPKEDVVE